MEQKRVSFKAAKALKEAGYPQQDNTAHYVDYEDDFYFHDWAEPECAKWINMFAAPTYLEVWLWLWREKHIRILFSNGAVISTQDTDLIWHIVYQNNHSDPEEAIIEAIEYIVDNGLLK